MYMKLIISIMQAKLHVILHRHSSVY